MKNFKNHKRIIAAGLAGLIALTLTGCGNKAEREQADAVRELQDVFTTVEAPPPTASNGSYDGGDSFGSNDSFTRPRTQTGDRSTATVVVRTPDGGTTEIPAVVHEMAQEAVRHIQAGQYADASAPLYQLMMNDSLSFEQRRAARHTLAQIQSRLFNDPNATEEELERARNAFR